MVLMHLYQDALIRFIAGTEGDEKAQLLRSAEQASTLLTIWCGLIVCTVGMSFAVGDCVYAIESLLTLIKKVQLSALTVNAQVMAELGVDSKRYFAGMLSLCLGAVTAFIYRYTKRLRYELARLKANKP